MPAEWAAHSALGLGARLGSRRRGQPRLTGGQGHRPCPATSPAAAGRYSYHTLPGRAPGYPPWGDPRANCFVLCLNWCSMMSWTFLYICVFSLIWVSIKTRCPFRSRSSFTILRWFYRFPVFPIGPPGYLDSPPRIPSTPRRRHGRRTQRWAWAPGWDRGAGVSLA